jgi:hypothetical protein
MKYPDQSCSSVNSSWERLDDFLGGVPVVFAALAAAAAHATVHVQAREAEEY